MTRWSMIKPQKQCMYYFCLILTEKAFCLLARVCETEFLGYTVFNIIHIYIHTHKNVEVVNKNVSIHAIK